MHASAGVVRVGNGRKSLNSRSKWLWRARLLQQENWVHRFANAGRTFRNECLNAKLLQQRLLCFVYSASRDRPQGFRNGRSKFASAAYFVGASERCVCSAHLTATAVALISAAISRRLLVAADVKSTSRCRLGLYASFQFEWQVTAFPM